MKNEGHSISFLIGKGEIAFISDGLKRAKWQNRKDYIDFPLHAEKYIGKTLTKTLLTRFLAWIENPFSI